MVKINFNNIFIDTNVIIGAYLGNKNDIYLSGYRNPSQKTTLKIQQSIKDFSAELSNISFVV